MTTSSSAIARMALAAGLLAGWAHATASELPPTNVAPIHAHGLLSFRCEAPALPHQRAVGESLGLDNFSQVYDARARLMGDVARACQRPGTTRVDVVLQPAGTAPRALPDPAARAVAVR